MPHTKLAQNDKNWTLEAQNLEEEEEEHGAVQQEEHAGCNSFIVDRIVAKAWNDKPSTDTRNK